MKIKDSEISRMEVIDIIMTSGLRKNYTLNGLNNMTDNQLRAAFRLCWGR